MQRREIGMYEISDDQLNFICDNENELGIERVMRDIDLNGDGMSMCEYFKFKAS